jgi:hypothetical protein
MTRFVRLLVVALAALFVACGVSSADSAVDTATSWGLLGTWRLDCKAQASRADPDLIFVVRSGQLFHDRNWGDGSDSSAVLSATATAGGGLMVTVKFASLSQTRQWAYVKQDDNHIRAMSNRNVDTDDYSVRDGKFTANGNSTSWQTRCN